jgi:hypothetical protein
MINSDDSKLNELITKANDCMAVHLLDPDICTGIKVWIAVENLLEYLAETHASTDILLQLVRTSISAGLLHERVRKFQNEIDAETQGEV